MLKVLLEKKYALRTYIPSRLFSLFVLLETNTNLDSVAMCGFTRLPFPPLRGGCERLGCLRVIARGIPPMHACVCATLSQRQ